MGGPSPTRMKAMLTPSLVVAYLVAGDGVSGETLLEMPAKVCSARV